MPFAPDNTNLMLGAGELFFNRSDVDRGFAHLGNCTSFQISFEDDQREVVNRMTSSLGTYRKVTAKRTGRLTIVGQEFALKNQALVMMATISALAQTGSTVTAEVLATAAQAYEGGTYQTAFRGISSVTLKQSATSLVENDDYIIEDATLGLITILAGGGQWTDGVQIDADYTYATDNSPTVRGGDTANIYGSLIFKGDPAAGPAVDVTAWNISIEPEGGLEFIGEDFLEYTLNAEILDDSVNHPNEPFFLLVDREDYR
jgi:hypothetical protein